MPQCEAVDPEVSTDLVDVLNDVGDVASNYKHSHDPARELKVDCIQQGIDADDCHCHEWPQQDTEGLLGHVIDDELGGLLRIDDAKDGVHCRRSHGSLEAQEQHEAADCVDCLQADEMANGIAPP